jgi:hypothetical protein
MVTVRQLFLRKLLWEGPQLRGQKTAGQLLPRGQDLQGLQPPVTAAAIRGWLFLMLEKEKSFSEHQNSLPTAKAKGGFGVCKGLL